MCESLVERARLKTEDWSQPDGYNVERKGQNTLEHLKDVAFLLATIGKVLVLLGEVLDEGIATEGSSVHQLVHAQCTLMQYLTDQLLLVAEKYRNHKIDLDTLSATLSAVQDIFVASVPKEKWYEISTSINPRCSNLEALVGSFYRHEAIAQDADALLEALSVMFRNIMQDHRQDATHSSRPSDNLMDEDFGGKKPAFAAGLMVSL